MSIGLGLVLAVATTGPAAVQSSEHTRIELLELDGTHVFAVLDLEPSLLRELTVRPPGQDSWRSVFEVRPVPADQRQPDPSHPAMAGSYRVGPDGVLFVPRFPIEPGLGYSARLDLVELAHSRDIAIEPGDEITAHLATKAPDLRPTTRLEAVYPSAELLPENLLKFYLHFSAPMSGRDSYRHIRLLDAHGREVELPFLELQQELWDRDGRRLTLLLDPGRIKRDLAPNREVGPPLRPGQSFELAVDALWKDANGAPLVDARIKRFSVVEADRVSPRPDDWLVSPPSAGTHEPLRVRFDEALDRALVLRMLVLEGTDGERVEGNGQTEAGEQVWMYQPNEPWDSGRYRLLIDPALEDLAGNAVGRPFEVHGEAEDASDDTVISIDFSIPEAGRPGV